MLNELYEIFYFNLYDNLNVVFLITNYFYKMGASLQSSVRSCFMLCA